MEAKTLIRISKVWIIILIIGTIATLPQVAFVDIDILFKVAFFIQMISYIIFVYALAEQKFKLAHTAYLFFLPAASIEVIHFTSENRLPNIPLVWSVISACIIAAIAFAGRVVPFWLGLRGLKRLCPQEPESNRDVVRNTSKQSENGNENPQPPETVFSEQETETVAALSPNISTAAISADYVDSRVKHLDKQPPITKQLEICTNCDTTIGRLERPYVFKDHVVCVSCYERLQKQELLDNSNDRIK